MDVNDFDETIVGPWEWDLKRLVASVMVAARSSGLPDADGRRAARDCASGYRAALAELATMSLFEGHHMTTSHKTLEHIDMTDIADMFERVRGQPGDVGVLRWAGGEMAVANAVKGPGETVLHLPAPGAVLPPVGRRRHRRDRLAAAAPADAHAHRDAPAVQCDPRRRRHRRADRRRSLAARFRPAGPADQGRPDRGG